MEALRVLICCFRLSVSKENLLKILILHCYRIDLVYLLVNSNYVILHSMHLDQLFYHLV